MPVELHDGDFVVVVGCSLEAKGRSSSNMTIASIVAVGESDLFLKDVRTLRIFERPIKNCFKIPKIKFEDNLPKILTPQLGDLVLSYTGGRFVSEKKTVGILIEIIDNPPNDFEARILSGEDSHIVPFDSLIVVEGR